MPLDAITPAVAGVAMHDVVPTQTYLRVRPAYRAEVLRLKARRRVRIGRTGVLCFESYETVLYHVQEVLRVEGGDATRVRRELAEYAPLVPRRSRLAATLLIDGDDAVACRGLGRSACRPGGLTLAVDGHRAPSSSLGSRPDPDDPVQYLGFDVTAGLAAALNEPTPFVRIAVHGRVVRLGSELRIELASDLAPRSRVTRLSALASSLEPLPR